MTYIKVQTGTRARIRLSFGRRLTAGGTSHAVQTLFAREGTLSRAHLRAAGAPFRGNHNPFLDPSHQTFSALHEEAFFERPVFRQRGCSLGPQPLFCKGGLSGLPPSGTKNTKKRGASVYFGWLSGIPSFRAYLLLGDRPILTLFS